MSYLSRRWVLRILLGFALIAAVVGATLVVGKEIRTSELQARLLSFLSRELDFKLEPGPSPNIRFPESGPYDQRLGYVGIPAFIQRLEDRGFEVTAQARFSPRLASLFDRGFFTAYREINQTGLILFDRNGHLLFKATYPNQIYADFHAIPPVILNTLLFIENRELLDETYATRNPAVEWDRLGRAVFDLIKKKLGADINATGGSTLATQIEKYRHSPHGITASVKEKFRQMGSASIRAYLNGPDTLEARRMIVLSYLNSVPLAAARGYGEVHGIGDGLWIWYGADFDTVNRLLSTDATAINESIGLEQALAYRQVLSLLLAQRRPSYFLRQGHDHLQRLCESYLNVLATAGVIPARLRDAARGVRVALRQDSLQNNAQPFFEHKTQTVLRTRLAGALGVDSLYNLDRINLMVKSTLDQDVQHALTDALAGLRQPSNARAAGITGSRLLSGGKDLSKVVYSLVLYERTPFGNLMRVQTDNYDQPLDINEGIRLDLGSTAKLRTTVHYLQLVEELYHRYADMPRDTLIQMQFHPRDYLSRWVVDQRMRNPAPTLAEILDSALERRYSASPGESFFTGGGLHTFSNFSRSDSGRLLSVKTALRDSVNLPFIRLMREIAYHYLYRPGGVARRMEEGDEALRMQYLGHFADEEGKVYLRRFHARYQDKNTKQRERLLIQRVHPIPARMATLYRSLHPEHDLARFSRFMKAHVKTKRLTGKELESLYHKYSMESFNLQDRGYIARIHPLELWLVGALLHNPEASEQELIEASAEERQQVYQWLFKTRRKHRQDKRIRTLLEKEAFEQIGAAWRSVGYPFSRLTPSYATAIGASADRPAALAELMGILVNDGIRYPRVRFESLHFAADTPYETLLQIKPEQGKRVLSSEVAAAVRNAVIDVVEQGTAIRLRGKYRDRSGTPMLVGGKTGTGDHVRKIFGNSGRIIGSKVISRTATFVFFLGDRFFGTLTAYVTGPEAVRYRFTSALPVQVLKSLNPIIEPLVNRPDNVIETPEAEVVAAKPVEPERMPSMGRNLIRVSGH